MSGHRFRSAAWFDDRDDPSSTALYLERYLNFGITRGELQGGRPVIGIAQTGSDLAPCNRHHLDLADRVRDGIRDAGGVPIEFPVHPIQETGRRPTAALDRNLAYLSLVEVLTGYPLDGVVLTTGCDKTTPALLMAAATVDLPAIVLSGGPMLNASGSHGGVGAGSAIWEGRQRLAAGDIDGEQFIRLATASAPSAGHCNTMGTALSMNCLAEALGMSLPGGATVPAAYTERARYAYETGHRAVELVREDLRPSTIMTESSFRNAIVVSSALGASTNCPVHLIAIARHLDIELTLDDWSAYGSRVSLLVNCQPNGAYLGEDFYLAGGMPSVLRTLCDDGHLDPTVMTVTGRTLGESCAGAREPDGVVIRDMTNPVRKLGGIVVLSGNFFSTAIMKLSSISNEFRERYFKRPDSPGRFECRVVVFDGPEDYRNRINDPALDIDADSALVIRGCGPVGYPGSAEVVNMLPPDWLVRAGITALPCIGDGRQSGTSSSPSILHVSPESASGGGLALVHSGDHLRIDLARRRMDLLVPAAEIARRRAASAAAATIPASHTPWEEIYRATVGELETGGCMELALAYRRVAVNRPVTRHSH